MDVSVEISLYPLNNEYIPPIQDFIDRVNDAEGLTVKTNVMSTQVFGNYEKVMSCLTAQMKETFEKHGKNVFVMKVLPGDLDQDH
ncbi:uncharacterized protein METZ01_LOCUS19427 [marine metagenome]|uniref:Thiamin/hydroxymethyl pyrimidine-binding YkoF putative domain-containing protein n=1 Tax=marine metagenome TaxID=408172 RepID=A0A381PM88_9ZZZZ